MRSKSELRKSLLERGYPESEVDQTIVELEGFGLIDDQRFAKSLADSRVAISRRGRQAILFEMIKKGLDKELINSTLSEISDEEELSAAQSLLKGRERQWAKLDHVAKKRRALGLLQRRGFSSKVVREALREK